MRFLQASVVGLASAFILFLVAPATAQQDLRTIKFESTEVTAADVAIAPDGSWLIFTMLGHLFRVPVEGGQAEQLTFGPHFDKEPAISPDGSRVAFVSDRDGGNGNLFLLDLTDRSLRQLTRDKEAGRPAWAPDGQTIAYLRFDDPRRIEPWSFMRPLVSQVVRIAVERDESVAITPEEAEYHDLFFLKDGRLGWAVVERQRGCRTCVRSRIEALGNEGKPVLLLEVQGAVDDVAPSADPSGLYLRRFLPASSSLTAEEILFRPLAGEAPRSILSLSAASNFHWGPSFATGPDGVHLYLGGFGRLWRVSLSTQQREPVPFRASVTLEVPPPTAPLPWNPPQSGARAPRVVHDATMSPDGRQLVFVAAGHLWRQEVDHSANDPAQRLTSDQGWESSPIFSPSGRQLAYLYREAGFFPREASISGRPVELRVLDLATGTSRTVASGGLSQPSWRPDGEGLVYVEDGLVVAVSLGDGQRSTLAEKPYWARPHYSPDQRYVFATHWNDGSLHRIPAGGEAASERITQLEGQMKAALVSPDGKRFAFRRNAEIWLAALPDRAVDSTLGDPILREEDVSRFSPAGGLSFTWTPDGSSLLYASGDQLWKHAIDTGDRVLVPVRLKLRRSQAPALLLRSVRHLDTQGGGFSEPTDILIEAGRIRAIGTEALAAAEGNVAVIDAAGRFAIPGLFDMHSHRGMHDGDRYLSGGVTSVRGPGYYQVEVLALLDHAETSRAPTPRYFSSFEIFEGIRADWWDSWLRIGTEEEGRSHARLWVDQGARFVKLYRTVPWPLQRAIVDEARRLGLPAIGHGMTPEAVVRGVKIGVTGFEHSVFPRRLYGDVLRLLAENGNWWDPTLTSMGIESLGMLETERRARGFIFEQQALRGAWLDELQSVKDAYDLGVSLQIGTDNDVGGMPLLHGEMEYFAEAGIPRFEVLRLATLTAAKAVGAEADLGTLDVGKLADLVLLEANPLDDIRNTQTMWRVIRGGWVFDPEELRPPKDSR